MKPDEPDRILPVDGRVEVIQWVDSAWRDGWQQPVKNEVLSLCCSIGIVTDETEGAVTVTSHFDIGSGRHCNDMTIPKAAITSRIVIAG